ncbi:hypothetical protein KTE91_31260 [Burkholderia multivorans]|uniref:hypothetical protein n=1 Tax=Burkholderia multivorans TaxID=87883 RepID=UPI001C21FB91|nr:hypothetical protein [Burkholderia multivorans]MBU9439557.1 hypothetical protein [Burkholderia multivorans]
MRFVKPLGKVAKFATVTMPLSIVGWQLNKRLFLWIRSLWTRAVNPPCPECDGGILFVRSDAPPVLDQLEGQRDHKPLYPWVCNHCGFGVLAGRDHQHVQEIAGRHRIARAHDVFGELEMQQREEFAWKHRIASRLFFVAAALVLANGIHMLASGSPLILALNWLSFALMFWVFGMKRSYRSWQVVTGRLFEEGAAKHWFHHERWFV